jgi:hypothetical protein
MRNRSIDRSCGLVEEELADICGSAAADRMIRLLYTP